MPGRAWSAGVLAGANFAALPGRDDQCRPHAMELILNRNKDVAPR